MLFILFLQAVRITLRVTAKHSCCSVLIRLVSDFRWAKMLLKCIWGFLLLSCHTVILKLLHVWGKLNSRTFEDTGLVNPSLWVQTTLALWCHVACVGFFSILMLKGSIHKSHHTTSTPVLSGLWMPPHGRSTHRTFQSVLKPSHTSNSATKKRDCSRGVMFVVLTVTATEHTVQNILDLMPSGDWQGPHVTWLVMSGKDNTGKSHPTKVLTSMCHFLVVKNLKLKNLKLSKDMRLPQTVWQALDLEGLAVQKGFFTFWVMTPWPLTLS